MKLPLATAGFITCLVLPCAVATAAAPQAPPSSPGDTVPVVLSVSGGSSLGSYQSGVNWALIEFFRRTASEPGFAAALGIPPHELVVAAGASAGNINSLASVLEWCRAGAPQEPEDSFFWKVWVRTGFEQLFSDDPRHGIRPEALFHRAFFTAVHLREMAALSEAPQRADCGGPAGIPIGITLTKLRAEVIHLGSIEVLTQRFATAFTAHVETPEAGTPRMVFRQPQVATRFDPAFGKLIALTSDAGGRIPLESVFAAAEASSAFPLAFPPRQLEFYRSEELRPDGSCPRGADELCWAAERDHFIDGGVFDNNPLDLGLGLFRKLHDDPARNRLAEPMVIYIDPDLHRMPLRAARPAEDQRAIPAEGVDALILLAKNVVPSARQYELHSLTRQLARDSAYGKAAWIRVADRSFPVMGEHLQAFGAFLGKPFREYDFYVGVYDGLRFLARQVLCPAAETVAAEAREAPVPSSGGSPGACTEEKLRGLIEGRHLTLGALAPIVMAELYAAEYPEARPPSIRQLAADDEKAAVLLALARANRAQLVPFDESQCRARKHLVERLLCANGFRALLHDFGSPGVRAVIERWASQPDCGVGAVDPPEACHADRTLVELMRNPERFANRTIERLIHQLWRVEAERHEQRNRAGLIEVLELAYRSTGSRYDRGLDLDPSSIPDRLPGGWRAMKLLPYYVAGTLGAPGLEFGYRPTFHLGSHVAVILPIAPLHFATPQPDVLRRSYLAAGAGVGYKHSGFFFTGADASLQVIQPWERLARAPSDGVLGGELVGYILGGKMRLALRMVPDNATTVHGGREWAATVGISDLNGILYWLVR